MKGVRFAPSPTGTFHLGNLRTAYIAQSWARALGQPFVVRFEDIDEPRIIAGSRESQLADMEKLGIRPDEVLNQSAWRKRHWSLLLRAINQGQVYPCTCTRKQVQKALRGLASAPHAPEAVYDGQCRNRGGGTATDIAWRFRNSDPSGRLDFIVARTDIAQNERTFIPAYHWACAIDDFFGGYGLLVRASDLAAATPVQRVIQNWLSRNSGTVERYPAVFHPALVMGEKGERLEKRTLGVTLAELIAQGWTTAQIEQKLAASFQLNVSEFRPGRIFGETEQITLGALGFWDFVGNVLVFEAGSASVGAHQWVPSPFLYLSR